jgi:hypothetical protein
MRAVNNRANLMLRKLAKRIGQQSDSADFHHRTKEKSNSLLFGTKPQESAQKITAHKSTTESLLPAS